ncbi:MAG: hypothetical protein M3Q66_00230 [Chloroflexota bacterium]|nr:hypothetical protein [Chloroflexota bacterium]
METVQPPNGAESRRTAVDEAAPARRVERRFQLATLMWLVLLGVTYVPLVLTETGQRLENAAVLGVELRSEAERVASLDRLSQITVVGFAAALGAVVLVAIARKRTALGLIVAMFMGSAVVATEVLKMVLSRPELVTGPIWILRNTFPSGTAATAAAVAVGALLISPDRLRWAVLIVVSLYVVIVAEALQATGWHRMSDTIGGVLVVCIAATLALGFLTRQRMTRPSTHGRVHSRVRSGLIVLATVPILLGAVIVLVSAAFPLLPSPTDRDGAVLQTAFPLIGSGICGLLVIVTGWLVEPYTLGRPADA